MTPTLSPDAVLAFLVLDLLLIVVAARALGHLAQRWRQPSIVGQIMAGVLLGPSLLGPQLGVPVSVLGWLGCETSLAGSSLEPSLSACLFPPQVRPTLAHLGQLGLVVYMMLVGLSVDTTRLRGRGRAVAGVSLATVAVPVGFGILLGRLLYEPRFADVGTVPLLPFQLLLGTLLAVTAFPVMAHMLRERHLDDRPAAVVALTSAAVITVLMFLLLGAATAAASGGWGTVGVRAGLVAVLVGATWGALRPVLARVGRGWSDPRDLGAGDVAVVLGSALAWSLASHALGVTVIVGAFLAGLVLPSRQWLRARLTHRLEDVTIVLLIPVLLTTSGLQTDIRTLDASMLPALVLLLVTAMLAKWGAGAAAARLAGMGWRDSHLVGALVNCRGLLPLVVAMVAVDHGIATPSLQVAAVVMALVTTAVTGPLCDLAIRARQPSPDPTAMPSTPLIAEAQPGDPVPS